MLQCVTCGERSDRVVTANSLFGAISLSYCPDCLGKGIEPYPVMVAGLIGVDGMDDVRQELLDAVYSTLAYHGKSEDEMWSDVALLEADGERWWQEYNEQREARMIAEDEAEDRALAEKRVWVECGDEDFLVDISESEVEDGEKVHREVDSAEIPSMQSEEPTC